MKKKAFTLIELLVVVAIFGLIASVVWVSLQGARDKAKIASVLQYSSSLKKALGADIVGEWSFDDCTATDTSGNGNNGTIYGASCADDTPYKIIGQGSGKKALSFDGSTSDYVIKNPFNNFPSTEVTVAFWMKSSDNTKSGTPFSYGGNNEFLIFNYRNFAIYIGGASSGNTGVSANNGDWHHIAVTWKSSNGNLKIYKNGVQVYSGTLRQGYFIVNGKSLVFGQEQDAEGGGFVTSEAYLGLIDEVRIYSRALTQAEIQKHYAEGAQKRGLAKNF